MIGEWIRFGVTALCVVGGLFALLTALLGLFRFDYALNRLHAAAIADIVIENDRRNSGVPLLDIKNIRARIEPGAVIREKVEIGEGALRWEPPSTTT